MINRTYEISAETFDFLKDEAAAESRSMKGQVSKILTDYVKKRKEATNESTNYQRITKSC